MPLPFGWFSGPLRLLFFPIASSWSYYIHFCGACHLLGYFALPHSHLLVLVRGSYIVGSVVDRVKALFLRQLWSHDLGSTRILVSLLRSWIRRFAIIISLLGGFEQAENSVEKNLKKFTGTLDLWKLLSRCSNLQLRSSHYNEKCANYPIFSVWHCPVTGG